MFFRPSFTVRVRGIIQDGGELLIVRHAHDSSYAALPGGHLEIGESLESGLRRELIEELGVEPEIGALRYINTYMHKDKNHAIEFFFEIMNGHAFRTFDSHERTHAHELERAEWVTRDKGGDILPKAFADDFRNGAIPTVGHRSITDLP